MTRFAFVVLLLFATGKSFAQDIYGVAAVGLNTSFREYSINSKADVSLATWADGDNLTTSTTSDIKSRYFHLNDAVHAEPPPWVLFGADVKTKMTTIDTIRDKLLSLIEYHNDTLWGLFTRGISFFDLKTRTIHVYDSIYGKDAIANFFDGVMKSAFDHSTETYIFSKMGQGWLMNPDTLCFYEIRSKTLTKKVLPPGFFMFDYSPLNDKIYYLYPYDDSAKGVYEYDYHNNVLKLHAASTVDITQQCGHITIDPVRNRLYYRVVAQNGPKDILGCYRINTKKFEQYAVNLSRGWEHIEFLDTYNDTTRDVPLSVQQTGEKRVLSYPNPFRWQLTVGGLQLGTRIQLIDIFGSVVYESAAEGERMVINTSHLAKGSYVLLLTDKEGIARNYKVVKEE